MTNAELDINFQETISEITADAFDDESKWVRTLSYDVPEDLPSGTYRLDIKVSYGSKIETETANLIVNECSRPVKEEPEPEEEEEIVEVIITPPTVIPPVIIPPTIVPEEPKVTVEDKSVLSNNFVLGSIIAIEIIAVIAGIALVVYLARRR